MIASKLRNLPVRSTYLAVLGSVALATSATPALADTPDGYVDLTFTGTVTRSIDETINVRNPDGSTVTLSGDNVPAYVYRVGDSMSTTIRFATNDWHGNSMLDNPACGGNFSLAFGTGGGGTGCSLEAVTIETPFGYAQLGGIGGDSRSSITGLNLSLKDGQWDLSAPDGSYSFQYVGVNPIYYDSATGTLSGADYNPCVNAYNCMAGIIQGTLNTLSFFVPIAGDYGKTTQLVGYDAGSAGKVLVTGSYSFSSSGGQTSSGGGSSGGPTEVPEPSMLALFGVGAAAVMLRRRRRIAAQ